MKLIPTKLAIFPLANGLICIAVKSSGKEMRFVMDGDHALEMARVLTEFACEAQMEIALSDAKAEIAKPRPKRKVKSS